MIASVTKRLAIAALLFGMVYGLGGCSLKSIGAGLLSEFLTTGGSGTIGQALTTGTGLLDQLAGGGA